MAERAEVLGKVQEILVERLDVDPADVVESAHMRDDLKADSLDLVELCPPHDADGRTARLAAPSVWRFLRGWSGRG